MVFEDVEKKKNCFANSYKIGTLADTVYTESSLISVYNF